MKARERVTPTTDNVDVSEVISELVLKIDVSVKKDACSLVSLLYPDAATSEMEIGVNGDESLFTYGEVNNIIINEAWHKVVLPLSWEQVRRLLEAEAVELATTQYRWLFHRNMCYNAELPELVIGVTKANVTVGDGDYVELRCCVELGVAG